MSFLGWHPPMGNFVDDPALTECNRKDEDSLELKYLHDDEPVDSAMHVLLQSDQDNFPSVHEYRKLLWACGKRKALAEAKQVHAHLMKNGLETNRLLGETLVDTLVKCGSLEDAINVFNALSHRTPLSWTAIIAGCSKGGQDQEALELYQHMREHSVKPSKHTFLSLLRVCGNLSDLYQGKRMHEEVEKHGFESDSLVCNALVHMYGRCRSMVDSQHVFDKIRQPDVGSWYALICGYAQQQMEVRALQLYGNMQEGDVSPDARILVTVLKACGTLAARVTDAQDLKVDLLAIGKAIHAEAVMKGYGSNLFIGSTLVGMYAKCGGIVDARREFDRLPERNEVSWNAMIAGYVDQQEFEEAFQFYLHMQEEMVRPNDRTLASLLKACSNLSEMDAFTTTHGQPIKLKSLQTGKILHVEAVKRGHALDMIVGTALVSMYCKCGSIGDAECIFEALPARNELSWSALISGYAQQEQEDRAFTLYAEMQTEGVRPNNWILVSMLKLCCTVAVGEENVLISGQSMKVQSLQRGKALHAEAAQGGYETNVFVGSSIIHMYSQCGSISNAQHLFDRLPERDVVLWNTMITGYAQQDDGQNALQLYTEMQSSGVQPEEATFLSVLKACSSTGSRSTCMQIYSDIVASNVWHMNVATALIHTFGKCGSMVDAQSVFDSLPSPDAVSWNALIAGYAQQGDYNASLRCFEGMCQSGAKPDGITFHSLLSACSQAGMVDQGLDLFTSMSRDHGICAAGEHYSVMVDLLGRAGLLSKVESLLTEMPMQPELAMWLSLLGACRNHGNVLLARRAFHMSVRSAPQHGAAYVLMTNIYTHAGMWECAKEVDELRRTAGAWKKRGQSWVEHEQEVHIFEVGYSTHQQNEDVFDMLPHLCPEPD